MAFTNTLAAYQAGRRSALNHAMISGAMRGPEDGGMPQGMQNQQGAGLPSLSEALIERVTKPKGERVQQQQKNQDWMGMAKQIGGGMDMWAKYGARAGASAQAAQASSAATNAGAAMAGSMGGPAAGLAAGAAAEAAAGAGAAGAAGAGAAGAAGAAAGSM